MATTPSKWMRSLAVRGFFREPCGAADQVASTDVRDVAFDPVKGGYDANSVDAALDRLEDAFARRERDDLISQKGEEARRGRSVSSPASFAEGCTGPTANDSAARPRRKSAATTSVTWMHSVPNSSVTEHDQALSVDTVRRAVFRAAKGDEGYEEARWMHSLTVWLN